MFNFPGPEIMVPFIFFAFLFGIIFVSSYFRSRTRISHYHAMETLIDKAGDMPEERFEALKLTLQDGHSRSEYRSGLIWSFIGIALIAFFALQAFEDGDGYYQIAIGLFTLAIVAAKLLNIRREDHKHTLPNS